MLPIQMRPDVSRGRRLWSLHRFDSSPNLFYWADQRRSRVLAWNTGVLIVQSTPTTRDDAYTSPTATPHGNRGHDVTAAPRASVPGFVLWHGRKDGNHRLHAPCAESGSCPSTGSSNSGCSARKAKRANSMPLKKRLLSSHASSTYFNSDQLFLFILFASENQAASKTALSTQEGRRSQPFKPRDFADPSINL